MRTEKLSNEQHTSSFQIQASGLAGGRNSTLSSGLSFSLLLDSLLHEGCCCDSKVLSTLRLPPIGSANQTGGSSSQNFEENQSPYGVPWDHTTVRIHPQLNSPEEPSSRETLNERV